MKQDDFSWIQKWYQSHCNGDWEHGNGIHLGTIDNPGWSFTVDLRDTELEDRGFKKIHIERTENDWIFCTVKNGKFEGACGLVNLPEILKLFRSWAEPVTGWKY